MIVGWLLLCVIRCVAFVVSCREVFVFAVWCLLFVVVFFRCLVFVV